MDFSEKMHYRISFLEYTYFGVVFHCVTAFQICSFCSSSPTKLFLAPLFIFCHHRVKGSSALSHHYLLLSLSPPTCTIINLASSNVEAVVTTSSNNFVLILWSMGWTLWLQHHPSLWHTLWWRAWQKAAMAICVVMEGNL